MKFIYRFLCIRTVHCIPVLRATCPFMDYVATNHVIKNKSVKETIGHSFLFTETAPGDLK